MLNKQQVIIRIVGNPIIRVISYPLIKIRYFQAKRRYKKSSYGEKIREFKNGYAGEKCFIVGNGPSLTIDDLQKLKQAQAICFGMNEIYELFDITDWRPTFFFVFDRDAIRSTYEMLINLPIKNIFLEYSRIPTNKLISKSNVFYYLSDYVFALTRGKAVTNYVCEEVDKLASFVTNVPQLCIEFAIYMGFKEIYLLGLDHDYSFGYGKNHARGIKEPKFHDEKLFVTSDMEVSTNKFQQYRDYADFHGIRIYNATRGGKLEVFERRKLDDVLRI